MNIKMIVSDLDHTLLRNDNTISGFTLNVLEEFKNRGGKIVLATGRNQNNAKKYEAMVHADGLVCLNGSVASCEDEILYEKYMDERKVKELVDELLKIENSNLAIAYPTKILTNNKKFVKEEVRDYCDFNEFPIMEIQKISCFTENTEAVRNINFDLYDCRMIENASESDYFVIMQKDIDKINGITQICKHFNLTLDEVAAFGDDFNDCTMLVACGIGVAVENASEHVKLIANEVCESNESDGVAKWIKKNCLEEIK